MINILGIESPGLTAAPGIAKEIVKTKIEGQNRVLRKYGLKAVERNVGDVSRKKLLSIEGKHA